MTDSFSSSVRSRDARTRRASCELARMVLALSTILSSTNSSNSTMDKKEAGRRSLVELRSARAVIVRGS